MTLRSLKKRQITAQTFNRRTLTDRRTPLRQRLRRLSFAAIATTASVAMSSGHLLAQNSFGQPTLEQPAGNTTPAGWNLRWQKSSKVTPQPVHVPQEDVFARPARTTANLSHESRQDYRNAGAVPTTPHTQQPRVASTPYTRQSAPPQGAVVQAGSSQNGASTQQVPVNAFRMAAVERRADQRRVMRQQAQAPATQPTFAGRHNSVQQASYVQRTGHNEPAAGNPTVRSARANDFFSNPFADAPSLRETSPAQSQPASGLQEQRLVQDKGGFDFPGADSAQPSAPESLSAPNTLRGSDAESLFNQLPESLPRGEAAAGNAPAMELPTPPTDGSPVPQPELSTEPTEPGFRDLMKDAGDLKEPDAADRQPADEQLDRLPQGQSPSDEMADSPSDLDSMGSDSLEEDDPNGFQNPFPGAGRNNESDADQADSDARKKDPWDSNRKRAANRLTCEEFRSRVSRKKIDTFTLDISPPFRPDLFDPKDYERERASFERKQAVRDWRGRDGQIVATGRLVDLAYENVVLETDSGSQQRVPISRLGEGDLGYLSDNWQLPRECLIEQVAYQPRSWSPLTMTWMAPNLCHKSNYYEEVNLERYGHTLGPWLQPVVSSAHFFANIAVTPYKMGIHPPTECRYALGYYRPGNCAPWIVPPVPISARGALAQGAFMTGAFWLIP